jgi:hypothetical protein
MRETNVSEDEQNWSAPPSGAEDFRSTAHIRLYLGDRRAPFTNWQNQLVAKLTAKRFLGNYGGSLTDS